VIAIPAATGAQGNGLARAILGDPASAYSVRALREASVTRALQGAYGAFFVNSDKGQLAAMARAARAAKLEHVILSTLEDAGESQLFAGIPTTYLLTSAYWENLVDFGMGPKRGADGRLAVGFPIGDRKIPWIAAEDVGRCAYGIFKAGRSMIGKTIGVAGEHLSGREIAAGLSRALGEPVEYISLEPQQHNDADRAARDVNATRALNPSLQRFDDWLRDNARRIPR
jgi:uncharacterized protein YbjT (DUF2867 family)